MKTLAVLVAAALLTSATLGSAASASHRSLPVHVTSHAGLILGHAPLRRLSKISKFLNGASQLRSGGTSSDAPQAAASPTPTSTSVSQYPDPAPILDKRNQVLASIQRVHFNQVSTAEKPSIEKALLTQVGDAACKGPKIKVHVQATEIVEATGSTTKFTKDYIRIKKKVWARADTKHKWSLTKLSKNTKIGPVSDLVTNPLPCLAGASFSQDSSTSQSVTLKNLVNLGLTSLAGASVWHLQGTLIDTAGETAVVDYFVTQDHFLPMKTVITTTTSDGFNLVLTVSLSKFDVKVNITAPKTK